MSARGGALAGRLRERVTILRQAGDRDGSGGAGGAWNAIATRWAEVVADGVGDAIVGEATSAVARFRITIRSGLGVLPGDRIGWGGRLFAVRAVIDDPVFPDRTVMSTEALR